jgi:hypothetical protein
MYADLDARIINVVLCKVTTFPLLNLCTSRQFHPVSDLGITFSLTTLEIHSLRETFVQPVHLEDSTESGCFATKGRKQNWQF